MQQRTDEIEPLLDRPFALYLFRLTALLLCGAVMAIKGFGGPVVYTPIRKRLTFSPELRKNIMSVNGEAEQQGSVAPPARRFVKLAHLVVGMSEDDAAGAGIGVSLATQRSTSSVRACSRVPA